MRQALRPLSGALIASICIAVPILGPAVAHALTVPGLTVSVGTPAGSAGVTVPSTQVQAPVPVPRDPIPPPPPGLPAPVAAPLNDARGTANDTINQAAGNGSSGGGSGSPSTGGSSGSGGGSSRGPTSGGSGTPHATGGGRTGATGVGPAASTPGARARARARSAAARGATPATGGRGGADRAGAPKPNGGSGSGSKKSSQSGIDRVINRIEQVIPGPVWALIGLLALLAAGFAIRSRFVGARARRLERHRQVLLGDVGLLQRALLPDVPEGLPGIDVSVAYRPAEGPAAGGDFYDVFELDDDRTAIIVGDVCGHGRQALAVTALMRYTLRAYLGAGFEPRVALQVAGRTIQGDPDGELTTVVLAIYDAHAGTLTYACAGHEPPIVLGPGAHDPVTVYSSPPLGGFMATGHRQTTLPLPPGSAVCFFTDGLVEARLGERMIGRGRLTELVTELAPGEGAQLLLERLAAAADRAPDDMAACLVRTREDAVDSSGDRIEEVEADEEELLGDRVIEFLTACGIPARNAEETVRSARGKAAEFGGAVLRVHTSGDGGRVDILPSEVAALPVPTLAAEARRRAALQISA
jgi:serine phosphatase RsbU (regulator of sigma subunit)